MRTIEEKCLSVRKKIRDMIAGAHGGHAGASLSIVEIVSVLYETGWLDSTQAQPDIFVLSKGHAGIGLYAVLAEYGVIDSEMLETFAAPEGPLMNHPDAHRIPGVAVSTGSLGHGLGIAVGMCMAAQLKKENKHIFCLLGDSECHEGSVWEAAMFAGDRKLNGITAIVDMNGMGNDGEIQVSIAPAVKKWESFGWKAYIVDGHDVQALANVYCKAKREKEQPTVVIAKTLKGRGLVDSMAGTPQCHYLKGSAEEIKALFRPEIEGAS